jgi:hypothetical protein
MAAFRLVRSSRLQYHLSHLHHRLARPTSRCLVKALPVARLRCLQRFLNLGDPHAPLPRFIKSKRTSSAFGRSPQHNVTGMACQASVGAGDRVLTVADRFCRTSHDLGLTRLQA